MGGSGRAGLVMTAAEILRAAAKRLEEKGWCQGSYYEATTGRCCAYGAIDRVGMGRDTVTAGRLLRDYVKDEIEDWNDVEGRTVEEVIAAMLAAAEAAS
jgi:hypothetical protein